MKLLPDAGIPYRTGPLLASAGHDVIHANDIRLGADDRFLLAIAGEQSRIIIMLDADFHRLLATSGAKFPSVIRLRLQSLRHEEAAQIIGGILSLCASDLSAGAVVAANRKRIRLRKLPIG